MFYTLICINNHTIACEDCMLSIAKALEVIDILTSRKVLEIITQSLMALRQKVSQSEWSRRCENAQGNFRMTQIKEDQKKTMKRTFLKEIDHRFGKELGPKV